MNAFWWELIHDVFSHFIPTPVCPSTYLFLRPLCLWFPVLVFPCPTLNGQAIDHCTGIYISHLRPLLSPHKVDNQVHYLQLLPLEKWSLHYLIRLHLNVATVFLYHILIECLLIHKSSSGFFFFQWIIQQSYISLGIIQGRPLVQHLWVTRVLSYQHIELIHALLSCLDSI